VPERAPFEVVDLSDVPAAGQDAAIRAAVEACQSGFDLAKGPLLKVALLRLGHGRRPRLVFVAHHLAIDGVSWRILLGDFSTAYAQLARGEAVSLPPKTSSFRTWTSHAASVAAALDADYWIAAASAPAAALPVDHARAAGMNTVASARDVVHTLDAATTTALLQDVPRAYATEITDLLLAGLALTFKEWTGDSRLLIDLEAHGREELVDDLDVSRTVGWFTAQFPLQLRIDADATPGSAIKAVKEQLRAVPYRGAGYGVLRHLTSGPSAAALAAAPAPEVLFNYFGQAGRVLAPELQWTLVPGGTHGDVSPRNQRAHLLEINGIVTDGCLTLTWTFSEAVHNRETVAALAERYERMLRLLVDHCRSAGPHYTPSDFPSAGLDQKSLDALVAKLSK
jgi:non-ribosomal peptide synthase protein (TIGR01720 family)